MTTIVFVIEDKEEPAGTPRFVFVELHEPRIGARTWNITTPNDWIGTGSGEYRVVRGRELELRDGPWAGEHARLVLRDVHYPADLQTTRGSFKRGGASYVSQTRGVSGARCEWSGRNIIPDLP
jgi:hypothetical protein